MSALSLDLRIALMNLIEHRRRTGLLGAAIAGVTMLFVLLSALSAGVYHTLIDTTTTLMVGHLNVGGFYKVTPGRAAPVVTDYPKVAEIVKKTVPEMAFMVERGRAWGKLVSERVSIQAGLSGVDIEHEPALRGALEIVSGNLDRLSQPNALLIFEHQAKTLHVKVGDAVTISAETTRGVANTIDFHVVAIARDVGLFSTWAVFVSNDSLRTLVHLRSDITGTLQIHVKPGYVDDLTPIATRLHRALARAGYRVMAPDPRVFWLKLETVTHEPWVGQKLDITSWRDELSFMMWTYRALQGMSSLLMIILLAIMVAGIMNTLWIATRERTREIGMLRAIGMQRFGVARLFILEASMLGLFGTGLGVLCGVLLTSAINAAKVHVPLTVQLFLMRETLHLKLDPQILFGAVALMIFVTGAAGLYPSLKAARRKPVDAMAHYG